MKDNIEVDKIIYGAMLGFCTAFLLGRLAINGDIKDFELESRIAIMIATICFSMVSVVLSGVLLIRYTLNVNDDQLKEAFSNKLTDNITNIGLLIFYIGLLAMFYSFHNLITILVLIVSIISYVWMQKVLVDIKRPKQKPNIRYEIVSYSYKNIKKPLL